jgi:hypothetical protein
MVPIKVVESAVAEHDLSARADAAHAVAQPPKVLELTDDLELCVAGVARGEYDAGAGFELDETQFEALDGAAVEV